MGSWMTQVGRHCRSSLAPSPLPAETLQQVRGTPVVVASGEHDTFLPPKRLQPAAGRELGVDVRALAGRGHLVPEEDPAAVVALVAELAGPGTADR
jgi:pimeloyl-ACP methyl ester carboxylesterase